MAVLAPQSPRRVSGNDSGQDMGPRVTTRPANDPRRSRTPTLTPEAEFRAIDLDIRSRRSLAPLLEAWPWAYAPCLEPGKVPRWIRVQPHGGCAATADATVRDLVRMVDRLPTVAKRCWRSATVRTFDIGIQSGLRPSAFEGVQLRPDSIDGIARVGGRLLVTVYAPREE